MIEECEGRPHLALPHHFVCGEKFTLPSLPRASKGGGGARCLPAQSIFSKKVILAESSLTRTPGQHVTAQRAIRTISAAISLHTRHYTYVHVCRPSHTALLRDGAARNTLSRGRASDSRGVDHGTRPSGSGAGHRDREPGAALRSAAESNAAAADSSDNSLSSGSKPRSSRAARPRARRLASSRRLWLTYTARPPLLVSSARLLCASTAEERAARPHVPRGEAAEQRVQRVVELVGSHVVAAEQRIEARRPRRLLHRGRQLPPRGERRRHVEQQRQAAYATCHARVMHAASPTRRRQGLRSGKPGGARASEAYASPAGSVACTTPCDERSSETYSSRASASASLPPARAPSDTTRAADCGGGEAPDGG